MMDTLSTGNMLRLGRELDHKEVLSHIDPGGGAGARASLGTKGF